MNEDDDPMFSTLIMNMKKKRAHDNINSPKLMNHRLNKHKHALIEWLNKELDKYDKDVIPEIKQLIENYFHSKQLCS